MDGLIGDVLILVSMCFRNISPSIERRMKDKKEAKIAKLAAVPCTSCHPDAPPPSSSMAGGCHCQHHHHHHHQQQHAPPPYPIKTQDTHNGQVHAYPSYGSQGYYPALHHPSTTKSPPPEALHIQTHLAPAPYCRGPDTVPYSSGYPASGSSLPPPPPSALSDPVDAPTLGPVPLAPGQSHNPSVSPQDIAPTIRQGSTEP